MREEIAAYLARTRSISVSPANIVIAPGCKIALFLSMMALLEPGDEVLYPDPGFPGYPSITLGLGAVPVPFTLSARNQFQPDPAEIASKITPRTRMLLTNSPGNPTGTVYTDAVQRALAELAVKHDLWVLSDEIYARIIYGGEYLSMLRYPGMAERTLIIDGFSKSFAMTGWRLGYTVAPPEVVSALLMMAVNTYTCVAEFTQYAAIDALRDREGNTPHMVGEFARRREQFVPRAESRARFPLPSARRRVLCLGRDHRHGHECARSCAAFCSRMRASLRFPARPSARPGKSSSASRSLRRWRRCRKRSSASRKYRRRGRELRLFVDQVSD